MPTSQFDSNGASLLGGKSIFTVHFYVSILGFNVKSNMDAMHSYARLLASMNMGQTMLPMFQNSLLQQQLQQYKQQMLAQQVNSCHFSLFMNKNLLFRLRSLLLLLHNKQRRF